MRFYSRIEVVRLLEIDSGFLEELEQEEIIGRDAPDEEPGEYSERMLERVRVAYNLVHELEVNLAGAAIIVRMREDMSSLKHRVEGLVSELRGRLKEQPKERER